MGWSDDDDAILAFVSVSGVLLPAHGGLRRNSSPEHYCVQTFQFSVKEDCLVFQFYMGDTCLMHLHRETLCRHPSFNSHDEGGV